MIYSPIVAHVARGSLIESKHRGHGVLINASNQIQAFFGDPYLRTYARSAAKPLQAVAIVESGAMEFFRISEAELAVVCASHNGEPTHTACVWSLLHKLGLDESHLLCGVHEPFHQPSALAIRKAGLYPGKLHNNCSGKHAGMLAYALHIHVPIEQYTSPVHPVQMAMLQVISEMSVVDIPQIDIGIDGCGVPVFGLGIDRLAYAYAVLGSQSGLSTTRAAACHRIVQALQKHPEYLAGHDRFDTRLILATKGRIIGKMGAEGVFALTIPTEQLGFVLKIEDGSERALYPVVIQALKQLNLINPNEMQALIDFVNPTIFNRINEQVGHIIPLNLSF